MEIVVFLDPKTSDCPVCRGKTAWIESENKEVYFWSGRPPRFALRKQSACLIIRPLHYWNHFQYPLSFDGFIKMFASPFFSRSCFVFIFLWAKLEATYRAIQWMNKVAIMLSSHKWIHFVFFGEIYSWRWKTAKMGADKKKAERKQKIKIMKYTRMNQENIGREIKTKRME